MKKPNSSNTKKNESESLFDNQQVNKNINVPQNNKQTNNIGTLDDLLGGPVNKNISVQNNLFDLSSSGNNNINNNNNISGGNLIIN